MNGWSELSQMRLKAHIEKPRERGSGCLAPRITRRKRSVNAGPKTAARRSPVNGAENRLKRGVI